MKLLREIADAMWAELDGEEQATLVRYGIVGPWHGHVLDWDDYYDYGSDHFDTSWDHEIAPETLFPDEPTHSREDRAERGKGKQKEKAQVRGDNRTRSRRWRSL